MLRHIFSSFALLLLSNFALAEDSTAPFVDDSFELRVTRPSQPLGGESIKAVIILPEDIQCSQLMLTDPPRFVLDIAGVQLKTARESALGANGLVSKVRVASHDSTIRVVFDLKTDQISPPSVSQTDSGVTVIISSIAKADSATQLTPSPTVKPSPTVEPHPTASSKPVVAETPKAVQTLKPTASPTSTPSHQAQPKPIKAASPSASPSPKPTATAASKEEKSAPQAPAKSSKSATPIIESSPDEVVFDPEKKSVELKIRNITKESLTVAVSAVEIKHPGAPSSEEHSTSDISLSTNSLTIKAGDKALLTVGRSVAEGSSERVFAILFRSQSSAAPQKVYLFVEPTAPRVKLSVERDTDSLTFINDGNMTVNLSRGRVCPENKIYCDPLPDGHVFAGSRWKPEVSIPKDAMVKYTKRLGRFQDELTVKAGTN